MRYFVKIGIGLACAGIGIGVAGCTGTVAAQQQTLPVQGVVSTLSNGDSFDVWSSEQLTRVQLMNVAAPTPAGAELSAGCLGAEASAFLASVIPVGTGSVPRCA